MHVSSLPKAVTYRGGQAKAIRTCDLFGREQTLYRYATQATSGY